MALRRRTRTRGARASAVSNASATALSPATSDQSPRLIIVTGVSGSGRLSAMRVLEDLGFYCVDNMPVALAGSVMRLATSRDPPLARVALGIDARERRFLPHWAAVVKP